VVGLGSISILSDIHAFAQSVLLVYSLCTSKLRLQILEGNVGLFFCFKLSFKSQRINHLTLILRRLEFHFTSQSLRNLPFIFFQLLENMCWDGVRFYILENKLVLWGLKRKECFRNSANCNRLHLAKPQWT
jgi:hypothetical protein